jgi:hypothetical protein
MLRGSAVRAALLTLLLATLTSVHTPASATEPAAAKADLAFPAETIDQWSGHVRHRFRFDGRDAWVVEPAMPLPGNPWSWCMMFPDAFVQRCAAPQLVAAGFHHAFLDVGNTFGSPAAVAKLDAFHDELVRRGLAPRAALVGLSRGGRRTVGSARDLVHSGEASGAGDEAHQQADREDECHERENLQSDDERAAAVHAVAAPTDQRALRKLLRALSALNETFAEIFLCVR